MRQFWKGLLTFFKTVVRFEVSSLDGDDVKRSEALLLLVMKIITPPQWSNFERLYLNEFPTKSLDP